MREAWNVKAVRKVLNPDRDERQSCHVYASCEQAHVVKRMAFMMVAPEENACDRSAIYNICFSPPLVQDTLNFGVCGLTADTALCIHLEPGLSGCPIRGTS